MKIDIFGSKTVFYKKFNRKVVQIYLLKLPQYFFLNIIESK